VLDGATACGDQVVDRDDEGNDQEQVNQATRYVQGEATNPQQKQKNHKSPQHVVQDLLAVPIGIFCAASSLGEAGTPRRWCRPVTAGTALAAISGMSTVSSPRTHLEQAAETIWALDPAHTLVEFSAKHMMFTTVKGRFTGFQGTIHDVADDPTRSWVEAELDAASLSTGDEKRDGHLRSADFLDVETHPKITFRSTRIEGTREHFKLYGDLTIRGTTREVVFDTEFQGTGANPWGKQVAGFSASGEVNRKDFGLTWNVALESGGVLVSDKIKISLEVQAVKQE
jgi:polyisoprenoid-binding protein YceI